MTQIAISILALLATAGLFSAAASRRALRRARRRLYSSEEGEYFRRIEREGKGRQ